MINEINDKEIDLIKDALRRAPEDEAFHVAKWAVKAIFNRMEAAERALIMCVNGEEVFAQSEEYQAWRKSAGLQKR